MNRDGKVIVWLFAIGSAFCLVSSRDLHDLILSLTICVQTGTMYFAQKTISILEKADHEEEQKAKRDSVRP